MDYPNVEGRHDAVGNLTHDIDGNPLEVGRRIVGRSTVGGMDQALSPTEFNAIAKEGVGAPAALVPPGSQGLGRNVGTVPYDRHTRLPKEVILSNKIPGADLPGVYGHEIGHVIDQLAGEIPTEGLTRELKALYDVGNNPNRARGNPGMPGNWGRAKKADGRAAWRLKGALPVKAVYLQNEKRASLSAQFVPIPLTSQTT